MEVTLLLTFTVSSVKCSVRVVNTIKGVEKQTNLFRFVNILNTGKRGHLKGHARFEEQIRLTKQYIYNVDHQLT